MKRLIILFCLLCLSFDWGFSKDLWKPVNTALGWYYAMQDPEYHYIAWDLITDDWKKDHSLKIETFADGCYGEGIPDRAIVDIVAGVMYPPDYYKVVLVLDDGTGYTLCVTSEEGKWMIDCIWYE